MAAERWPADHRLHAGIGPVRGSGGRSRPQRPHHLRQYPRDRGLVARGGRCGTEDGGAAGRGGRADAAGAHRRSRERGRHPDLRPRRARRRGRNLLKDAPRRHRADQAASGHRAAAQHGVSGRQRQRSARPTATSAHFEITVDDFAQPAPSSRGALAFGPSRDGAQSRCDIILDLSGGRAPVLRRRPARRLSARRPRRSQRRCSRPC